uniref:Uncharacterized protein n=1 Tax=Anguilla anguilla TaxID=7936 RepID=A0A0E9V2T3_ANGAN
MLWHDLKRAFNARNLRNIKELKQFCGGEWSKIPPSYCASLIGSYWKHLVEAIATKMSCQLLDTRVHILFPA